MEQPASVDTPTFEIPPRLEVAGLWVAATFCYIYADFLALYDDYLLGEIIKGNFGPFGPITQGLKLGIGLLMSLPAIAIVACLVASTRLCRYVNLVAGVIFMLVTVVTTVFSPDYYYWYFGTLEIAFKARILWTVWHQFV